MSSIKTYILPNPVPLDMQALRGHSHLPMNSVMKNLKDVLAELMAKTGIKDPSWITFVMDEVPKK